MLNNSILLSVKKSCVNVIHIPFNRYLDKNDSVIQKLSKESDLDEIESMSFVQDVVKNYLLEINQLLKEIEIVTENGGNINECKYLNEAWRGDSFDSEGNEGLSELKKYIDEIYDILSNDKKLIKKCKEEIEKN